MVLPDTECYSKILRMRCATPYEEDTTYCIKSKHSDMRKLKEIALCKWKQPDTVVYACALLLPVKSAVKCRPTGLGNSNAHDTSLRVRDGMDIPLHNRWFTPQWSSHRSRMPKKKSKIHYNQKMEKCIHIHGKWLENTEQACSWFSKFGGGLTITKKKNHTLYVANSNFQNLQLYCSNNERSNCSHSGNIPVKKLRPFLQQFIFLIVQYENYYSLLLKERPSISLHLDCDVGIRQNPLENNKTN